MSTRAFKIHGLDCAEEVAILKRAIGPLVGGEERLGFDVLAGKMSVAGDASDASVIAAVAGTGMRAQPWPAEGVRDPGASRFGRNVATIVSGVLTLTGFVQHAMWAGGFGRALAAGEAAPVPLLSKAFYLAAIVAGAWYVAPKAWASARSLRPDMNVLMTLAVAGAIGIGEWFEGATVAFLFALSLALEAWSVGRARRAVEALLSLAPPTVRVRAEDGVEREVPVAEVSVGTRFVVRPGERIGLDGRIVAGRSEIDQAPITGESMPVERGPEEEVFAGTINGRGALEVESTRSPGDTTLARILRRVEDARSRRSPSERWVERFARVYTPIVFALAIIVLLALPHGLRAHVERGSLPRAGAARDRLPLRAGRGDAGRCRRGPRRGGEPRRAAQGRRSGRDPGADHAPSRSTRPGRSPADGRRSSKWCRSPSTTSASSSSGCWLSRPPASTRLRTRSGSVRRRQVSGPQPPRASRSCRAGGRRERSRGDGSGSAPTACSRSAARRRRRSTRASKRCRRRARRSSRSATTITFAGSSRLPTRSGRSRARRSPRCTLPGCAAS